MKIQYLEIVTPLVEDTSIADGRRAHERTMTSDHKETPAPVRMHSSRP